ncbi:hypothetical protein NVP1081O_287 [Vibrio phage 1.081.O._10N.286.52.C2]|nr:hypothetical protein NVP1081O_287 [Vibrio phage 1.081.O._10N.286.52.C2]
MAKSKKSKKVKKVAAPNFVAKHMNTFNHATVEDDRKKQSKRLTNRKMKHKGKKYEF